MIRLKTSVHWWAQTFSSLYASLPKYIEHIHFFAQLHCCYKDELEVKQMPFKVRPCAEPGIPGVTVFIFIGKGWT